MTDNREELEKLRESYRADPKNKDTAIRLAELYIDRGWLNEGIEIYKNLIELYPNDFSILLAYGNVCFSKQNIKESLSIFKKLTILKPKRVEGWNNLGILQLKVEDYELAKNSFKKVLELEPENHGALLNMGNYYDHIGNSDKTIEMFKRATAVRPDFIDAWFNLGNAYLKAEQYQKAIDIYNKSLKYNPKFSSAFKNIGFAYEQLVNYEKAEEFYLKALDLNKTDAALYVNIATVYTKQMKYDKAKDFFLRSVKLAPREPAGWLGLREVSLKKGDIKTYVRSTLAVLHRLDSFQIAESLKTLRKLRQNKNVDTILKSAEKLEKMGDELDAERMIAYCRSEKNRAKATLLYKRLRNITNPSDHVLHCLAEYCIKIMEYDIAVQYIQSIKEKDIFDIKMLWIALIEKKELNIAEYLIEKYLLDNQDCFEGWYQLARIKAMTGHSKEAKEYLRRSLETGFTDLDELGNEQELKKVYNAISN